MVSPSTWDGPRGSWVGAGLGTGGSLSELVLATLVPGPCELVQGVGQRRRSGIDLLSGTAIGRARARRCGRRRVRVTRRELLQRGDERVVRVPIPWRNRGPAERARGGGVCAGHAAGSARLARRGRGALQLGERGARGRVQRLEGVRQEPPVGAARADRE